MSARPTLWFDAHLDLAYLAVRGRDMTVALDAGASPHPPAAVTLPELESARVRLALGTIFTEPVREGPVREGPVRDDAQRTAEARPERRPERYPAGDVERAHAAGRAQLEAYLTWQDRGLVALDLREVLSTPSGVGEVRAGLGVSEVAPIPVERRLARATGGPSLHLGVLIENADPVRSPAELPWWRDRGVVAIGLAWAESSRYAAGNRAEGGLTAIGREMVRAMDDLGIAHDVSHLSDRALDELLSRTDAPVIASHSNARALLASETMEARQRHLSDATIAEIGRRGGVVGLNLVRNFVRSGLRGDERPTVAEAVRHVEHVCAVMGHRRGVGLGSDMDGGISAADLPLGIDRPGDLWRLAEALSARGWSDAEVAGFAWGNWSRFWEGFFARAGG